MKTTEKILSQLVIVTFIVMGVFAAIEISIQRQYLRSQSLSFHNTLMSNLYYGLTIGLYEANNDAINFYLLGLAKEGQVKQVSLWSDTGDGLIRYSTKNGEANEDPNFEGENKIKIDPKQQYSANEQDFIVHSYPSENIERFNVDLWFKEEGADPYFVGHLEVDFDLGHINEQLFNMVLRYVYLFLFFNIAKILVMFVFIRQSIIKPIQSLVDHTVEVSKGLFPKIPKIKKNDELSTLNNMVSEMTSNLEQHITGLDKLVAEKTAQLQIKTKDMQNMLQNLQQGIFTIEENFEIHHEYSSHLEEIIESKDIAGKDPMELIFKRSNLTEDQLAQLESTIDASLGSLSWAYELNSHCLPKEIEYKGPFSKKTKILELDWQPLGYQEDGSEEIGDITIDKIMVVIRDVSSLRELKAQAEEQQLELQMIGEILEVGPKKLRDFIDSQVKYLAENETIIKEVSEAQEMHSNIPLLFRNIHTVKGNCRSYKLSGVIDLLHSAEQYLSDLRKNVEEVPDSTKMLDDLKSINENLTRYANLIDQKIGVQDNDNNDFIKFFDQKIQGKTASNANDILSSLISHRIQANSLKISDILEKSINSLPDIAESLGKRKPIVQIAAESILLKREKASIISDIFTHLFRNSIDHGIELPEDRNSKGKKENGTINLHAVIVNENLEIDFYDDGAGLNLGYLRKKGIEEKIFQGEENDEQIAELIFHSGLSTTQKVTDISGRGVGMDAVRSFIQKEGGSIELVFTDKLEGNEYRSFKTKIIFPKSICIDNAKLENAA